MTTTTNFYYAILIAAGVGAVIFMFIVTLTHEDIFGHAVEDKNVGQQADQGYFRMQSKK
jgi:hypothetical protein